MLNIFLLALALNPFSLEWNSTWRTDVPYEVSIDLSKLGGIQSELSVYADDRAISTTCLKDGVSKETRYRFSVPSGTKRLEMRPGESRTMASERVDNIFAAAEWKADRNVRISRSADGILIESTGWSEGSARCRVPVPEGAAGKPAAFEMDAASESGMPWSSLVYMNQYDAAGNLLPEKVYDPRWTTLVRPAGKQVCSREPGYIHPRAAMLEMVITLRPKKPEYDIYGLELANPDIARPRLKLTRLSLRPAAVIPFPGLRQSFWSDGVSGAEGDKAFELSADRCLWYATRSMASWAQGLDVRSEEEMFFPANAGTLELWVKPKWENGSNQRQYIFDAANHMAKADKSKSRRIERGSMVSVSYDPSVGRVKLEMRDCRSKAFQKECKADIPSGEWCHVAVTWTPGRTAVLYLNGRATLTVDLQDFEPLNPQVDNSPNDNYVVAVYVGSDYKSARALTEVDRKLKGIHFLSGSVDMLRASSVERYSSDFTPASHFELDRDTRALFDFNGSIDGVSGGGLGWISGSVRADEDVLEHKFGAVQYYPDEIPDSLNPRKLLHPRVLTTPSERDFAASSRTQTLSLNLKAGESRTLSLPEGTVTDYIEIRNDTPDVLRYPIVLNNDDIDARSYGDIAESLCRDGLTDREKVNRIFDFLIEKSDYFCNHQITYKYGSDKPTGVEYSALKMLNSYCGFECGPLNNLCMSLFATAAGCATNMTAGYGHSFEEVFYDGRNHVYDLSRQSFIPSMSNDGADGLRESEVQSGSLYRDGGSGDHFTRLGIRNLQPSYVEFPEKFAMSLNPGEALRFWNCNDGTMNDLQKKTFANQGIGGEEISEGAYRIDRFFPEYANAFLTFDGTPSSSNPAFTDITPSSFCYSVNSCYPIVAAEYEAVLSNGKKARLEISTDLGKTFRPFTSPADYEVRARHGYLIRVCASMKSVKRFRASTELETNNRVLTGLLREGENHIRLKMNGGESATISYQYRTPGKDITFGGAVQWGAYRGYEQSLVLLDPGTGKLEVPVSGLGENAGVRVKGDLDAKLSGGKLTLSSKNDEQRLAWLTVVDGECSKTLTVLVSPGARLVPADALFSKRNEKKTFSFKPLGTGEYTVFSLFRFSASPSSPRKKSMLVKLGDGARTSAGAPINNRFDYLKDVIGPEGGRGIWRWDTAMGKGGHYAMTPVKTFNSAGTSSVEYLFNGLDGPVELKAVLLLPEPSTDFYCDIAKALFGRNYRPYTINQ